MNLFLWDSYEDDEVNDKIKYWVDCWEDLINNFNKKYYGLDLMSPHLLIRDIKDEIKYNELRNNDNLNYFYEQLKIISSKDKTLEKILKYDLILLKKNLKTESNSYLLEVCNEILKVFSSGEYFKNAYYVLKEILLESNWNEDDKKTILTLTQHLIVELLIKGYDLETIKEIPQNIFSTYFIYDEGSLSTDFPHRTDKREFRCSGELDYSSYKMAIKNEIDDLSISDRLDYFLDYWKNPEEYYYIFEIIGLKGKVDFNIGKVNFYSPDVKKYSNDNDTIRNENFSKENDELFVNAAVLIPTLDKQASKEEAMEIINQSLDLLKCYKNSEINFEISEGNWLIVNKDEEIIGGDAYSKGRKHKWTRALNLNQNKITNKLQNVLDTTGNFLYKPSNEQTKIEKKISYSLHWFRKGDETLNNEDKLLNYWVCIENILNFSSSTLNDIMSSHKSENTCKVTQKLLAPIQISNYIYNIGWELYYYLKHLSSSSQYVQKYNEKRYELELPEDIIEKCQLNPSVGEKIHLKNLVNNLDDLGKCINRKIIKEKVSSTNKFYNDSNYAYKRIEEQIKQIQDDILLIYRYRNQIVHNAHFDNTIIPFYVKKAEKYAGDLLRKIIHEHNNNNIKTIEEILVKKYVKMNKLLEKLNQNVEVDLINIQF